jgi:hypothetical protein
LTWTTTDEEGGMPRSRVTLVLVFLVVLVLVTWLVTRQGG